MKKCITVQSMISKDSGCLVEQPDCCYARKFGFSFECRHPDRASFHAHILGELTRVEALEQYRLLRQKRRDEFMASLDETIRKHFSSRETFFCQSILAHAAGI